MNHGDFSRISTVICKFDKISETGILHASPEAEFDGSNRGSIPFLFFRAHILLCFVTIENPSAVIILVLSIFFSCPSPCTFDRLKVSSRTHGGMQLSDSFARLLSLVAADWPADREKQGTACR